MAEIAIPISIEGGQLDGDLAVPDGARGIVLFAHGSGSGRHSPRNRYVAEILQNAGLATLLLDLLTPQEEAIDVRTAALRFDIGLLARRLEWAMSWLMQQPQTDKLPVGLFGASTGAAAALIAAADLSQLAKAVVSRGGRPDLAGSALRAVNAPTLFIVGGEDTVVIELNKRAMADLQGEKDLVIIPGATHLFEEPGALEAVAGLAKNWFLQYLNIAEQRGAA
jgi:dienelactone hydrolase